MPNRIEYQELIDLDGYKRAVAETKAEYADFAADVKRLNEQLLASYKTLYAAMIDNQNKFLQASGDSRKQQQIGEQIERQVPQLKDQRAAIDGVTKAQEQLDKVLGSIYARQEQILKEEAAIQGSTAKEIAQKKRLHAELVALQTQLTKLSKATTVVGQNNREVTGTYNKLQKELADARKELKSLDDAFDSNTGKLNRNNKAAVALAARITQADAALKKIDAGLGQFGRNVGNYPKDKGLGGLLNTLSGLGVATGAGAAVGALITLGTQIVEVGAAAEDLDNLLENSLRNNKAAAIEAGALIRDFAASSRLEVDQVTEAFTRLAGIGIIATKDQLVSLSDIALSKKKTITDYVEAIADAQRGEFERLKEFSIDAQKNGDKVTFTYNGVRTTVANTDRAISDFLISIGKMPGVIGATDKASQSLNGRWSTFKDNIKGIATDLYQLLLPSLNAVLGLFNKGAEYVGRFTKGLRQLKEEGKLLQTLASFIANPIGATRDIFDASKRVKATPKPGEDNSALDAYRKEIEAENKKNEATRKAEEARAKYEKDRDKREREREARLAKSLENTRAATEKELSALDVVYKKGLMTESDYVNQRAQVQQKGIHAEQRLLKAYGKRKTADYTETETRLNEVASENAEKRRKIEDDAFKKSLEAFKQAADADKSISGRLLSERLTQLEKAYIDEQSTIETAVQKRQITEAEGAKRLGNLTERYLNDVANATIASSETVEQATRQRMASLEDLLRSQGKTEAEIEQALADEKKRIADEEEAQQKARSDRDIKLTENTAKTKKQIEEEHQKEMAKIRDAALETLVQGVNTFFEISSANRSAELEALEKQKAQEIEMSDGTDRSKKEIEAKYAARQKDIRRREAIAERQKALFSISISIAKGIAEAGANLPLAILVGAIGALQIAAVLAKPLPEFWKGTSDAPEGPAWVGERGYELIESKKGGKTSYRLAAEKQITYLNRHDKVYNHQQSKHILATNQEIAQEVRQAPGGGLHVPAVVPTGPTKAELTEAFISAIGQLPVHEHHEDAQGKRLFERRGHQRTELLNNYFSLPRKKS
ncbi:hypothetical protein GGR92_005276 [Spirosoma lacussanchae]|uniref:hypothetical protein n=1 Tax=Spirosoma lacussanchae TaxID=1884249 RepID=UPI001109C045|nr:hypothetical protein [Spirosoma lacussanchae]